MGLTNKCHHSSAPCCGYNRPDGIALESLGGFGIFFKGVHLFILFLKLNFPNQFPRGVLQVKKGAVRRGVTSFQVVWKRSVDKTLSAERFRAVFSCYGLSYLHQVKAHPPQELLKESVKAPSRNNK